MLTGGGSYCEGGAGVHIGLTGSNVGISYPSVLRPVCYRLSCRHRLPARLWPPYGCRHIHRTCYQQYNRLQSSEIILAFGSEIVTIIPTVNPMVSITTGVGDYCMPGELQLPFSPIAVNGGTSPTYKWSVNGVLVSIANTYTYIPARMAM